MWNKFFNIPQKTKVNKLFFKKSINGFCLCSVSLWMDSYYFYWCSLMPHQWLSRPQSWFLSSLDMNSSLRTSLLPGIKSYPDLIYTYTFPDLESDIFLWLLLVENGILVSFYLFIFWSHCLACGILVPRPGIKPRPPSLEAQHLNH